MKKTLSLLTSGCLIVVTLFTGCGFLDALDTFHYVGIYEDSYKKEGLSEKDRAGKFDEFLAAITATTGYATEVIERDANYRMARLVIPNEKSSGLNRVILYDSYGRREIIVRAEGFDLSLSSEQDALRWRLDFLRERWPGLWPGVVACLHKAVEEHEAGEARSNADPEDDFPLSSEEQSLLAKVDKILEDDDDDYFVSEPLDVESILSNPRTTFGIIICHFFEAKQRDLCWKFALMDSLAANMPVRIETKDGEGVRCRQTLSKNPLFVCTRIFDDGATELIAGTETPAPFLSE